MFVMIKNVTKRSLPLLLSLILCVALFSSCEKKDGKDLKKFTSDVSGAGFVDSENGNVYTPVRGMFEPVSVGKELGVYSDGIADMKIFSVPNSNGDDWLVTDEGDLLCKSGVKIPEFSDLELTQFEVMTNTSVSVAEHKIMSSELVSLLAEKLKSGKTISYPAIEAKRTYIIRFSSKNYPMLFYSVKYIEYDEDIMGFDTDENGNRVPVNLGRYFLYESAIRRCTVLGAPIEAFMGRSE